MAKTLFIRLFPAARGGPLTPVSHGGRMQAAWSLLLWLLLVRLDARLDPEHAARHRDDLPSRRADLQAQARAPGGIREGNLVPAAPPQQVRPPQAVELCDDRRLPAHQHVAPAKPPSPGEPFVAIPADLPLDGLGVVQVEADTFFRLVVKAVAPKDAS